MKLLFIIFTFIVSLAEAQTITVNGYIKDAQTKEALIGVNVYNKNTNTGTVTNSYGYYSISFNVNDTVNLCYSYIGYKSHHNSFIATKSFKNTILLSVNNSTLKTVEITGSRDKEESTEISVLRIPMKDIKQLPTIIGEPDVIRSFQLMPGVQSGKEGSSGLYVRGGSPDQNLFLLDDVELYNVSHIGGFLSTFDPNAINDVKLYKGGFPAQYGGRLSSVVDLRMKDGNKRKTKGEVFVGTLATKLSIEGPIKKDTSSYFLSARRCNVDIFTRPISLLDSDGDAMGGYTFYDLYGKYNRILSNKDRIFVSFYAGRDKVFIKVNDKANTPNESSMRAKNNIKWGNVSSSIKYNRIFSPKMFGNFIISYSQYKYQTELLLKHTDAGSESYSNSSTASFLSGIQDVSFKMNLDIFASNSHKIKTGVSGIFHHYKPGKSTYTGDFNINEVQGSNGINAIEMNYYIEDIWKVSEKVAANIGLRLSDFIVENSSYLSLQPRININYNFHKGYSLKASYVEMQQAVHLVSSSSTGLPSDIWLPATDYLRPEKSKQLTLGIIHTIDYKKHKIETSIEAYYKKLNHLIEYKEGTTFFGDNQNWEEKVEINGSAEIYGIEFLAQKKTGKTTGWISYTWSKNYRTFDNINNGKPYPYKYDRRHDFSIVVMHQISEGINISATWVYSTGSALTLATNNYKLLNSVQDVNSESFNQVHVYNGRNSYRMPAFHKLDLGISFVKKKPKGVRTWTIGVYNAYARQNAFYLYYKKVENEMRLYQYSLFPFMPSISYSFKF